MPQQLSPESRSVLQQLMDPNVLGQLPIEKQKIVQQLALQSGYIQPKELPSPGWGDTLIQGAAQMASPSNIGASIGMAGGAALGMPGVGAAVGGMLGKGVELGADAVQGYELPPDAMQQILIEGAFQGGAQLIPSILGRTFKKLTMPRAEGYGPAAQQTEKLFQEFGIQPVPSEVIQQGTERAVERYGMKSLGGRATAARFLEPRAQQASDAADAILREASQDPSGAGLAKIKDAITGKRVAGPQAAGASELFHEAAAALYGDVDKSLEKAMLARAPSKIGRGKPLLPVGATTVDTAAFREIVREGFGSTPPEMIMNSGLPILHRVSTVGPEGLSFKEAQLIRSGLLAKSRDIDTAFGGREQNLVARLTAALDSSMEKTVERIEAVAPGVKQKWRDANAFYKTGAKTFENQLVQEVAKKQPDLIMDLIRPRNNAGGGGTSIDDLRTLKASVLGEVGTDKFSTYVPPDSKARGLEAWRGVGRGLIEKVINQSTIGSGANQLGAQGTAAALRQGQIQGEVFSRALAHYDDAQLAEIFDARIYGPGFVDKLRRFGDLVSRMENAQKILGVPNNTAVELLQIAGGSAGAIGGMLVNPNPLSGVGGAALGAGAVILPGYAIAKVVTSPLGLQWLTRGLQTPQGAKTATEVTSRILALAGMSAARLTSVGQARAPDEKEAR